MVPSGITEKRIYRPTWVEIDLDALRFNARVIRSRACVRYMIAVVKADAYGHGAKEVSLALEDLVDIFGVATIEEGIELREAGIKRPILILGSYYNGEQEALIEYRLTPVVGNWDALDSIRNTGLDVHLKFDTGMTRIGFDLTDGEKLIEEIKGANIRVIGLMSHFANADLIDLRFTELQLKRFLTIKDMFAKSGIFPHFIHIANSAASLKLPGAHFNTIRPGISLYGYRPSEGFKTDKDIKLKRVMSWKSSIIQIRKVPRDTPISYGSTFVTKRASTIGVVCVGYADGLSRLLSNRIKFLVKKYWAPVVGNICMDLTMVDLTDIPDVRVGDEVILIGEDGDKKVTAEDHARLSGTISYEILCSVGKRVPRIYIGYQKK